MNTLRTLPKPQPTRSAPVTNSLDQYLRSAQAGGLLSRQGEVDLARAIESAQDRILDVAAHFPEMLLQQLVVDEQLRRAGAGERSPALERLTKRMRTLAKAGTLPTTEQRGRLVTMMKEAGFGGPRSPALAEAAAALLRAPRQPSITAQQTRRLRQVLGQAKRDKDKAAERLICANLRLVVSVARKYARMSPDLDLMDVVQEGNIGLMRAVESFDHKRGFKFSTYAVWWIRQSIVRGLQDKATAIRLPVHMNEAAARLRKTTFHLSRTLARRPTTAELAAAMNIPEDRVEMLQTLPSGQTSLDAPLGDDNGSSLAEVVSDLEATDALENAVETQRNDRVRRMLHQLGPREAKILSLRFGLENGNEETLEQIGKRFQLTRERIRQLEKRALRDLNQAYRRERSSL